MRIPPNFWKTGWVKWVVVGGVGIVGSLVVFGEKISKIGSFDQKISLNISTMDRVYKNFVKLTLMTISNIFVKIGQKSRPFQ